MCATSMIKPPTKPLPPMRVIRALDREIAAEKAAALDKG